MTKKKMVKDQLRDLISSGSENLNRLPGERELAQLFRVSRNTIRGALHELETEGWIKRLRKTGTLIRYKTEFHDKGLAGLIIRTAGHLFDDRYHYLLTEFTNAGYSVQTVSTSPIVVDNYKKNDLSIHAAIGKLLKAAPEVLVVDGYAYNRLPHLDEIRERHPIMLDFFDSQEECPTTGVWVDYRKAGYLAGKFLTDRGCRRPVLFTNYVPPKVRFNPASFGRHRTKMLIDGFRRAMTEAGLDPETAIIISTAVNRLEHRNILYQLSSDNRMLPDGFCAEADYLTVLFIKILLENRGRIPGGLVLAGIGNTPWSQDSATFPFTSVDLNLKRVAQTVIQQAELPPKKRSDIFIDPILIKRCGKPEK